jgi:hypothetical protein
VLDVCALIDAELKDSCPYDEVLFSILATIDWTSSVYLQMPAKEAAPRVVVELAAAFLITPRTEDRRGYADDPMPPPSRAYSRARSRATFNVLFRPLPHDDKRIDGIMWDGDDVPRDADERHWWTVVEAAEDGPFHLEAGIHRANRIGLVRCATP